MLILTAGAACGTVAFLNGRQLREGMDAWLLFLILEPTTLVFYYIYVVNWIRKGDGYEGRMVRAPKW